MQRPFFLIALAAGTLWPLLPSVATAQAEDTKNPPTGADGLEEIVVTAQRRGESVQSVPISMNVLTSEALQRQGVRDVADIARLTPGLSFNNGGDRGLNTIAIRGIESNAGASTTGIYIDDVPIQSRRVGYGGGSPFPRIFDLERIEVLRGPQGTLFGAGSQGGTVRYITAAPSLERYTSYARGEVSATRDGEPSYEAGAALGGPVSDQLGMRVSAWHRRDGGWIDRVDFRNGQVLDEDANSSEATVLSAALKFVPVSGVEITPAVFYQNERARDVSSFWPQLSDPGESKFRSGNVLRSPRKDRFVIPSLTMHFDAGAVDIVSVSAYLDRKNDIVADYTEAARAALFFNPYPPPGVVGPNTFYNSQRSFTQEIRVQSSDSARLRWIAGAFYQQSKQNSAQYDDDPSLASEFFALTGVTLEQALGQPLVDGRYIYVQDPYRGTDKQYAGFGQVDFDATDRLTLTAGLRVARTIFDVTTSVSGPFGGQPFTDSGSQSETPVTPKLGVQYKFNPDSNLYASAAKGYRVGGFNPRQLSICQPQLDSLALGNGSSAYDSDNVWSYEIGSKNQLLDRRLTLNASVFYIQWQNIQQFVNLASCLGGFIANLGEATSQGVDLEWATHPMENLTLGGSIGYTHGEFNETVGFGSAIAVTRGDRLPGSPFKAALSAQYDFVGPLGLRSFIRTDYQYSSADPTRQPPMNTANTLNFVPGYYTRPRTNVVGVRAGVHNDAFELSIFADNLLNEDETLERFQMPVTVQPFRATTYRPRTIGLTASYRY